MGVRGGCSDGLIAGFKCAIHRSSWRPVPYRCDRDSPGLDSRSCCSAVRRCPARIGRVELLVIRFADVGSPIERHDSTASRGHCERGRGRGRNQCAAFRASRAGGDPRHLALPHERHVQWICRQSRRCELQRRTTVAWRLCPRAWRNLNIVRPPSLPGPLGTSAQPRSSLQCAGVSSISRTRC